MLVQDGCTCKSWRQKCRLLGQWNRSWCGTSAPADTEVLHWKQSHAYGLPGGRGASSCRAAWLRWRHSVPEPVPLLRARLWLPSWHPSLRPASAGQTRCPVHAQERRQLSPLMAASGTTACSCQPRWSSSAQQALLQTLIQCRQAGCRTRAGLQGRPCAACPPSPRWSGGGRPCPSPWCGRPPLPCQRSQAPAGARRPPLHKGHHDRGSSCLAWLHPSSSVADAQTKQSG